MIEQILDYLIIQKQKALLIKVLRSLIFPNQLINQRQVWQELDCLEL